MIFFVEHPLIIVLSIVIIILPQIDSLLHFFNSNDYQLNFNYFFLNMSHVSQKHSYRGYIISWKPCQIARPLLLKKNVVSGRDMPWKNSTQANRKRLDIGHYWLCYAKYLENRDHYYKIICGVSGRDMPWKNSTWSNSIWLTIGHN